MKTKWIIGMLAFLLAVYASASLMAQTITPQPPFIKLTPFADAGYPRECGGTVWADYNGDGNPDVLIFGYGTLKLYENNGDKTFTDATEAVFGSEFSTGLYLGSAAWLDYNKDGIQDLLIAGSLGNDTTILFKGQGSGSTYTLAPDATVQLQNMQSGSGSGTSRFIAVADYNNDTYPDILMSGYGDGAARFYLYKNNEGTAFELQTTVLEGNNFLQVSGGSVAWGDYNNDGNVDILFSGNFKSPDKRCTGVYKNKGDGTFELVNLRATQDSLITVESGEVAWIDYDKDGYLDIVMTGQGERLKSDGTWVFDWWNLYVLHNNQDDTFTQVGDLGLGLACESSIAVGDMNDDGYDDIAIIGQYTNGLFYNNAGSGFVKQNGVDISEQINKGMATMVDYDADGDLDLVLVGNYIEPTILEKTASIHPAFGKYQPFTEAGYPRESGGIVWADYDNDGRKDAFIFGYGTFKLYRGISDTAFADSTAGVLAATPFKGVWLGSALWLDYDKNGNMDLLLSGNVKLSDDTEVDTTILYKNQGAAGGYTLVPDPTIHFPAMNSGDGSGTGRYMAAEDYNGDGYPDILISGYSGGAACFYLYKNNTGTEFELQTTPYNDGQFPQLCKGSVAWGDFNKDGHPDILFNGNSVTPDKRHTGIYKNNGDGTFGLVDLKTPQDSLITLANGEVAWIDYDNDGNLDVLMTGQGERLKSDGTWGFDWWNAYLLHNNGDETFTQVANHGLTETCESSVAVGDINNDGYQDVAMTGQNGATAVFYNNAGTGEFVKRTTLGITGDITKGMASLVDYTNNNMLDIAMVGSYVEPLLFINKYPVEADPEPAPEPPAADTVIRFTRIETAVGGADFPQKLQKGAGMAWGDYNNDGHLDVLLWGYDDVAKAGMTRLYKNKGDGTFENVSNSVLGASFPQLCRASAAWFDYNNDGRLDLVITGATGIKGDSVTSVVADVYFNMGPSTSYMLNKDITASLQAMESEKNGGASRSIAIADYNNDGFADILMMGVARGSDGKNVRYLNLYKNLQGNGFELQDRVVNGANFVKTSGGIATFGDYNNDGHADILFAGYNTDEKYWSGIYKNNGDGTFTEKTPFGTTGIEGGEIAWVDYDNDGYLDVLITGTYWEEAGWQWWNTYLFHNNGDDSFTKVENTGLGQTCESSIALADLDNNGYVDIALVGQHEGGAVFYNNGDGTFMADRSFLPKNNQGTVSMVDFNNDGKLDVFTTGTVNTSLWRNEDGPIPTAPAKPSGLNTAESNGSLTLSWTESYDKTASYNLFLQKAGAKNASIALPLAIDTTSGFLKIGLENAALKLNNSITISGLANGQYSWGVQTVSNGRAVSGLAKSTASISSSTGVQKATLSNLSVYKRGKALVVKTDIAAENAELEVYNTTGSKVWSKRGCFLGETEISGLQQGAYVVVIRAGSEVMVDKAAN
ncbi:MAG: T9SS type A sorting domain-containing protein [Prevotellaceae bacterium]|jgi:hypothetical protein|nr:T9SS type A sorting domain-containing protein [Prevotellaceae bacterium]